MTKETLDKANELLRDIANIKRVVKKAKTSWIKVICPEWRDPYELCYSVRFQDELE